MSERSPIDLAPGACNCAALNGSHTEACPQAHHGTHRTCWCCGGLAPAIWAALWSDKGSRCYFCGERCGEDACRARVGVKLDTVSL